MGMLILRAVAVGAMLSTMVLSTTAVRGQVAGSTKVGATKEEMKAVALGWSAKKKLLGKTVYNEKDEKIGTVEDLIITSDNKSVSYAIVSVGGFLGMGDHDVAIPARQLKENQGKIVLAGASKEALKSMPKFEYAK
jgi:sporulation protein YlmC with PRC-barrel domain